MIDLIIVNCHHNLTRHIHIKIIAIQVSAPISIPFISPHHLPSHFPEVWACYYWSDRTFSTFTFSCRLEYIVLRAASNFQTTVDTVHISRTIVSSPMKRDTDSNRTCVIENIHGFCLCMTLFMHSFVFVSCIPFVLCVSCLSETAWICNKT